MRIIITNDGIREIKDSIEYDNQKSFLNQEIISHPQSLSRSRSNLHSCSRTNHLASSVGNNAIAIGDSMSYSNIDLSHPIYKTIEIKQKKLSIPSNKSLLYDYGKEESGQIIKHMSEVISSIKSSFNNSLPSSSILPKLKQSYSLKELISPDCFRKLEEKLKLGQKIALHNRKTDERIFRDSKTGKEVFRELNDCKKSTIAANNTSIIAYLLEKTTISDCFVKNMASYNKNRINRLNKITQRILLGKEKEKVLNKEMQCKIDNFKMNEKNKYKADIESIEENMRSIKKIVDINHPTSKKDKRIFKFLHSELIRDYWRDNKYDRYCFNSHLSKSKLCYKNVSSRSIQYFRNALPFSSKKENE